MKREIGTRETRNVKENKNKSSLINKVASYGQHKAMKKIKKKTFF